VSEQNILNPAGSVLNPDFPLAVPPLTIPISEFTPRKGGPYTRIQGEGQRVIPMTWKRRSRSTADQLRQWFEQYRQGYFSFFHSELNRYYSGRFVEMQGPTQEGYEQWTTSASFVELPGLAMYANPTNFARDGVMIDSHDDMTALTVNRAQIFRTGNFLSVVGDIGANNYAGHTFYSDVTNDYVEWQYFGYGFALWSKKDVNAGHVEVSLDGVVVQAALDCYSAVTVPSANVYQKTDVLLGTHRVKLRVTGTKNASAANYYVYADAIQVIR